MKTVLTILSLLLISICSGQDTIIESELNNEYNKLLNYKPSAFHPNLETKSKNKFLESDLNSIGDLRLRYRFQEEFQFSKEEIKWLEEEINQLAVAFFMEKKPILIKKVGGYSGCPEERIGTEDRNGIKITIMNFCYTCSGANQYEENFIKIFNGRMEKLLRK